MNFIDFHCHLDAEEFDENRQEIVGECFAAGFSKLVTVADPYEAGSFQKTAEILGYHKHIVCMAAAHPHNADHYTAAIEKNLLNFVEKNGAAAIGEAGLDFHYNLSTPENQLAVFKRQIEIARDLGLALVIHSRQAEEQVLRTLDEAKFDLPVVFHCYTGNIEDAREILTRGYYISISGIVTFKKKSEYLQEIVEIIPLDRIFTETDAPYLSPEPFRGKVNRPLRATFVAEKIAEIKGVPVQTVNDAVNRNFAAVCPIHRLKIGNRRA